MPTKPNSHDQLAGQLFTKFKQNLSDPHYRVINQAFFEMASYALKANDPLNIYQQTAHQYLQKFEVAIYQRDLVTYRTNCNQLIQKMTAHFNDLLSDIQNHPRYTAAKFVNLFDIIAKKQSHGAVSYGKYFIDYDRIVTDWQTKLAAQL